MKTPYRLALLLVTTALSACSTVTVTTDYDRAAAFGTYRTYSIAPGPDGLNLPMYCEITLRKVVRSELAARGLTEAEGKDGKAADLAIVWRVFLEGRTSAQERVDPEGELAYAYGDYTYWTGMPANLYDATRYSEGTLVLDVVDMKTEKLVFRGKGTAVAMGPEKGARNIEKAVKEMVAALPRLQP